MCSYIILLSVKACKDTEFECNPGKCIPGSWKCDSEEDCENGSDEAEELCSKYQVITMFPTKIFL